MGGLVNSKAINLLGTKDPLTTKCLDLLRNEFRRLPKANQNFYASCFLLGWVFYRIYAQRADWPLSTAY